MEIDYPAWGYIGSRCVIWNSYNAISIYNTRSGYYTRRNYILSDDGQWRFTGQYSGSNLSLDTSTCTEEKYVYHPEYPLNFTLVSVGVFIGILTFLFKLIVKRCFVI